MSAEQLRVDPSDGGAYTYNEIYSFYRQQYTLLQIKQYWSTMRPWNPPELRFERGDRVLCNVGERRLAGTVLDKDVEDPEEPGEKLPYVVKTDPIGTAMAGRTISAPSDEDLVICRERCFNAKSEMELTKWAAPIIKEKARKPLRFSLGDEVSIRVQDSPSGHEQWVCGKVVEAWPALPGRRVQEGFLSSADAVPYKVEVGGRGAFYCHRDEHTLIRKPENVPRIPGKTISKRFEIRTLADGTKEKFDHVTLRGKTVSGDSDDELV